MSEERDYGALDLLMEHHTALDNVAQDLRGDDAIAALDRLLRLKVVP